MDFSLTEEQRAFQATARQFAREAMMPHARDWDEGEVFPVESLRAAAALGFAGIYVREDFGGSGLTRLDAALIRSGRLEQRVPVSPPGSIQEVARIFEHYLHGSLDPAVVAAAARCAHGWTPADVEAAVRAARGRAAARWLRRSSPCYRTATESPAPGEPATPRKTTRLRDCCAQQSRRLKHVLRV